MIHLEMKYWPLYVAIIGVLSGVVSWYIDDSISEFQQNCQITDLADSLSELRDIVIKERNAAGAYREKQEQEIKAIKQGQIILLKKNGIPVTQMPWRRLLNNARGDYEK